MISKYPVQFQGCNNDATDAGYVSCMAQCFDVKSEIALQRMFSREYLHVVAWDANGNVVYSYDNRP